MLRNTLGKVKQIRTISKKRNLMMSFPGLFTQTMFNQNIRCFSDQGPATVSPEGSDPDFQPQENTKLDEKQDEEILKQIDEVN